MKSLRWIALFSILLSPLALAGQEDPLELVKETADRVLHEVSVHKASLQMDSSGVYVIVNKYILPHFDFSAMTRSAVGKYWRKASDAQQKQLQDEFTHLLVRTYGVALMNYSGQEIIYKPLREGTDPDRVMIETLVAESNGGPQIPVNYRLIKREGEWKVYDVVIDGVSLVSNYRTSFAGQIRRSGIDGLIAELNQRNKG